MCPIFADALQSRQARIKRGLCAMCGGAARQAGRKLCGGCVFVRRCLSGARRRFLGSYHCTVCGGPLICRGRRARKYAIEPCASCAG